MRKKIVIRTDQPRKEIWSSLSYFESQHNCKQFLKNKFTLSTQKLEKISNELTYTIRTAKEYYHAADQVSILTQPLQIYYSMTNLSKSLFIATYGKKSHGLQKAGRWNEKALADMRVKVLKDGTFPQLHSCYCREKLRGTTFKIGELFSVIPELKACFESVYKQKSNALRITRPRSGLVHIIDPELEKYGFLFDAKDYEDHQRNVNHNKEILSRIEGISEKYDISRSVLPLLHALVIKENWKSKDVEDPAFLTVSGEEYFVMSLRKGEKYVMLPELSSHFLIMYILGMLSLVITAVFGRTYFKYHERGYRFVLLEAGHLAEHFYLTGTSLNLGVVALGGFFDDEVNALLKVDGVNEATVYMLVLGHPPS